MGGLGEAEVGRRQSKNVGRLCNSLTGKELRADCEVVADMRADSALWAPRGRPVARTHGGDGKAAGANSEKPTGWRNLASVVGDSYDGAHGVFLHQHHPNNGIRWIKLLKMLAYGVLHLLQAALLGQQGSTAPDHDGEGGSQGDRGD